MTTSAKKHSASLPLIKIVKSDLHAETTSRLAQLVAATSPGRRLPSERELSEQLGVGRSTIREAVRSLTFIGAIQSRQGDGMYVSPVEDASVGRLIGLGLMVKRSTVLEVIEARRSLELEAVRLAAERHTQSDRDELESIMLQMALATDQPPEASRLDLEFHVKLAQATHNSVLAYFVDGMRSLFEIWMHRAMRQQAVIDEIIKEHNLVLEAVFARDPEQAARLMSLHLEGASARLLSAIGEEGAVGDYITSLLAPS